MHCTKDYGNPTAVESTSGSIFKLMIACWQWLVWTYVDARKVPLDHIRQAPLQWSNPKLWLSYEDACQLRDAHGYSGTGFITTEDDGLILIDLDMAFDAEGNLKPWAQEWVDLDAVAERSPSKTGLHLYALWNGPPLHTKRNVMRDDAIDGRVEVYTYGKFFTVTEDWLDDGGQHATG